MITFMTSDPIYQGVSKYKFPIDIMSGNSWIVRIEKASYMREWQRVVHVYHCVKNARIRTYSGPYFPAFGLNTQRYSVSGISPYSVWMLEYTDQNNSEYGHFLHSLCFTFSALLNFWSETNIKLNHLKKYNFEQFERYKQQVDWISAK